MITLSTHWQTASISQIFTHTLIELLHLKSIQGQPCEAEFKAAIAMYGDDLNAYKLIAQLGLLPQMVRVSEFEQSGFDFDDFIKFLQFLDNSEKLLLSEVLVLVKLLIVIPATNTISECSFSAIFCYFLLQTPESIT